MRPRPSASFALASGFWLLILLICAVPLFELSRLLITEPLVWRNAWPDAARWTVIVRTVALNTLAATLATTFAYAPGVVLGLSRSRWTILLWLLMPASIVMPSIVMTYGWAQVLALLHMTPKPQSMLDVTRCVVSLAAWSWPAGALLIALWLRRVDRSTLPQAALDGALRSARLRLAAPGVVLAWGVTFLLAMQEFAVYEPTGIRVISVDVRAAWDTGMDLAGNPILLSREDLARQTGRIAAGLIVALPGVVIALTVATSCLIYAWWLARDFDVASDHERSTPVGKSSALAQPCRCCSRSACRRWRCCCRSRPASIRYCSIEHIRLRSSGRCGSGCPPAWCRS
ncbi:MAG: hypothetical protein QM770_11735 [Tepidisphaeraceae bacterium]